MPRILILSSYVATGHVGLSAGQPACQILGINVTAIPTTVLSNHPGWPDVAAVPIAAEKIRAMTDALHTNGMLADHDAVLVGYMPSTAHVDAAVALVDRVRSVAPKARVLVDPILGDWPKGLYVPEDVAHAVRDRLTPLADIMTPNRFELEWLTGQTCTTIEEAKQAALALDTKAVYVTSAPSGAEETGILSLVGGTFYEYRTPRYPNVPHGIGDVFAALIAAGFSAGRALGHVHALACSSQGGAHLDIVGGAEKWVSAPEISAKGKV